MVFLKNKKEIKHKFMKAQELNIITMCDNKNVSRAFFQVSPITHGGRLEVSHHSWGSCRSFRSGLCAVARPSVTFSLPCHVTAYSQFPGTSLGGPLCPPPTPPTLSPGACGLLQRGDLSADTPGFHSSMIF